jgi:HlyD family secretion protein
VSLIGLTLFTAASAPIWRGMFRADDIDNESLRVHTLALLDPRHRSSADARGDLEMKAMLKSIFFLTSAVAALAGCNRSSAPPPLLGTLEWDRIAVPAEVSEPITQILVKEGDVVDAHQLLLTLDPRRTQAQLDAARRRRATPECRARRAAPWRARRNNRRRRVLHCHARKRPRRMRVWCADRALRSVKAQAQPQADLDNANAALRQADADANAARANLDELLHGTRPEDLAQGEAALAQAQASVAQLPVTLERLSVRAPRAGRVDALPFKLGDRPPQGQASSASWSGTHRMRACSFRNRSASAWIRERAST